MVRVMLVETADRSTPKRQSSFSMHCGIRHRLPVIHLATEIAYAFLVLVVDGAQHMVSRSSGMTKVRMELLGHYSNGESPHQLNARNCPMHHKATKT